MAFVEILLPYAIAMAVFVALFVLVRRRRR
jgi:uncharacterized protein (TIGR03382 family)